MGILIAPFDKVIAPNAPLKFATVDTDEDIDAQLRMMAAAGVLPEINTDISALSSCYDTVLEHADMVQDQYKLASRRRRVRACGMVWRRLRPATGRLSARVGKCGVIDQCPRCRKELAENERSRCTHALAEANQAQVRAVRFSPSKATRESINRRLDSDYRWYPHKDDMLLLTLDDTDLSDFDPIEDKLVTVDEINWQLEVVLAENGRRSGSLGSGGDLGSKPKSSSPPSDGDVEYEDDEPELTTPDPTATVKVSEFVIRGLSTGKQREVYVEALLATGYLNPYDESTLQSALDMRYGAIRSSVLSRGGEMDVLSRHPSKVPLAHIRWESFGTGASTKDDVFGMRATALALSDMADPEDKV